MQQNHLQSSQKSAKLTHLSFLLFVVSFLPISASAFLTTGNITINADSPNSYTLPTTRGSAGSGMKLGADGQLVWGASKREYIVFVFADGGDGTAKDVSTSRTVDTVFSEKHGSLPNIDCPSLAFNCTITGDTTLLICYSMFNRFTGQITYLTIDDVDHVIAAYSASGQTEIDNACIVKEFTTGQQLGFYIRGLSGINDVGSLSIERIY